MFRSTQPPPQGSKRSRDEESKEKNKSIEEGKKNNNNYPLLRDRYDCIHYMSLDYEFTFNPPEIGQFLDFFVEREIQEIRDLCFRTYQASTKAEAELSVKSLAKIVTDDPRRANLLDQDFLHVLVLLLKDGMTSGLKDYDVDDLKDGMTSRLKLHAAAILKSVVAYSKYNLLVMDYVDVNAVLQAMCSIDCELQVQAIWLLRTIALGVPFSYKMKILLERALEPLTLLLINGSTNHDLLFSGSMALAVICQVHPLLPRYQIHLALQAFKNLLQYESSEILPSACSGLAYLCDNSGMVIFEDEDFETLIDRLIVLIDSASRVNTIAGLKILGSIVRWGMDYHIEVIIKKETLWSLECLLREKDAYYVQPACWIISNITARRENHIEDVICCECIDSLIDVVQKYELLEVKVEAAWAITNAIFGANVDQIKCLKKSCVRPLWNSLKVFSDNLDILWACLEGLVRLEGVEVACNGALIDDVELKSYLVRLRGRQFQLADDDNDDIDELPRSKKLRTINNIGKYDGDIELNLTCTFKEGLKPDSLSINVNLGNVRLDDSANMAEDQMEVKLPR